MLILILTLNECAVFMSQTSTALAQLAHTYAVVKFYLFFSVADVTRSAIFNTVKFKEKWRLSSIFRNEEFCLFSKFIRT